MPAELTPNARRWAELVKLHEASGLSIHDFAVQHGVNHRTLKWWRSSLRRTGALSSSPPHPVASSEAAAAFLEVRATAAPLRLVLARGGAHLVVDRDTDLQLLRDVLEALC